MGYVGVFSPIGVFSNSTLKSFGRDTIRWRIEVVAAEVVKTAY